MRIALDGNVPIYAEGHDADRRHGLAADFLRAIHARDLLIPIRAVGELRTWLAGKARLNAHEAVERSNLWIEKYPAQAATADVFIAAGDLIAARKLQVWHAVFLAADWAGGAHVSPSEDLQNGVDRRGVTVANPFADMPLPIVMDVLNSKRRSD